MSVKVKRRKAEGAYIIMYDLGEEQGSGRKSQRKVMHRWKVERVGQVGCRTSEHASQPTHRPLTAYEQGVEDRPRAHHEVWKLVYFVRVCQHHHLLPGAVIHACMSVLLRLAGRQAIHSPAEARPQHRL